MYEDFFRLCNIPCCIVGEKMNILDQNNEFIKRFGEKESILEIIKYEKEMIEEKQDINIEYKGNYYICKKILKDEKIYLTLTDVTPKLNMLDALEYAVEGISKINESGEYIYLNDAYASICGYKVSELINKNWEVTVHPRYIELMRKAYKEMLEKGKVTRTVLGIRKEGEHL